LSKDSEYVLSLKGTSRTWLVRATERGLDREVEVDREKVSVEILEEPSVERSFLVARINGRILRAKIENEEKETYRVRVDGRVLNFSLEEPQSAAQDDQLAEGSVGPVTVVAPMSGRVIVLNVSSDVLVQSGQALVVLEAMKMQNDITSPRDGMVKEIYVKEGALVKAGDRLCLIQ
jgi:biotin carboxyl carrier protein